MTEKEGQNKAKVSARRKHTINQIFKTVVAKGWAFYREGAPVDSLKFGVLYQILSQIAGHQVTPRIIVPLNGFRHLGRVTYGFPEGNECEDPLMPGLKIPLTGFELQEREVKILSLSTVFMPYDVFQAAIQQSLQDMKEVLKNG